MLAFLAQIATGIMDEAGALQTWKPDNFERRAGVHLLGTCRMETSPTRPRWTSFIARTTCLTSSCVTEAAW